MIPLALMEISAFEVHNLFQNQNLSLPSVERYKGSIELFKFKRLHKDMSQQD